MHIPVLTEKVIAYLNPQPNENFVDCTVGGGGHANCILQRTSPRGKVLGIDWDPETLQALEKSHIAKTYANRLILVNGNFADVRSIIEKQKFSPVHGILLDIGFSSDQLSRGKGFSFQTEEPLDMRYSPANPVTAEKIVNFSNKQELKRIFEEYGEEQFAEKISQTIIEKRTKTSIRTTSQLVHIVKEATPAWYHRKHIHPATKVFQALRIAINNELENLRTVLQHAVPLLAPAGRLAVISFHSLEDRIVKNFLKDSEMLTILTKKPITASQEEVRKNPRSRSAKLRVAIKKTIS